MDLQLFLGRPFHNVAENGVDESEIYYGRIPQAQLDPETEFITEKINSNVDLQNMFHVIQNAYKLYYKTRNKPTADGMKKAKEFGTYVLVGVHDDKVVNQIKGGNFPIMNLHERVLSVLSCKVIL